MNRRDVLAYASAAALTGSGARAQPMPVVSSTVPTGMGAGPLPSLGAPPSLDLSFMTPGTMPSGVTFTRASTAKYFDVSGTMQSAAANAPRWDYNPTSHALNGLLIEESRANVCLWSADLSHAGVWTVTGITSAAPTVTANQTAAPDGTVTAARLVFPAVSAAGGASIDFQQPTMTAAAYAFSVYLKGNAGGEQLYLIVEDGTASVFYKLRVTLTTAWQRFTLTTPALTAAQWNIAIGADLRDATQTSTPAQTIFAWGAQVEQGAFATSYIPTTAAAVTRAADACSLTDAALFLGAAGKTIQVEGMAMQAMPAGQDGYWASLHDATPTNLLQLITPPSSSSIRTVVYIGTVTYANGADTAIGAEPAVFKAALANGTVWNSAVNGALVPGSGGASAVGTGTFTILNIGSGSTAVDGYIRRVRYWPRALTAAELQSVTT